MTPRLARARRSREPANTGSVTRTHSPRRDEAGQPSRNPQPAAPRQDRMYPVPAHWPVIHPARACSGELTGNTIPVSFQEPS